MTEDVDTRLNPENIFEQLPRRAKRRKKTAAGPAEEVQSSHQNLSVAPKLLPVSPVIGVGIQALTSVTSPWPREPDGRDWILNG